MPIFGGSGGQTSSLRTVWAQAPSQPAPRICPQGPIVPSAALNLWRPDLLKKGALKGWWAGDRLANSGGSPITAWTDNSGTGNTASGIGNDPDIVGPGDGLNGMPVAQFTGANGDVLYLPSGTLSGFTQGAIFFVSKASGTGFMALPVARFGSDLSGEDWEASAGNSTSSFMSDVSHTFASPSGRNAWHIGGFRSKQGDWRFRWNGTEPVQQATGNFAVQTTFAPVFGADAIPWKFDGQTAEIVLCDSFLTTEQAQLIEGYLAWKWGLVSALDAAHPYKTVAPTPDASQGAVAYSLAVTPGSYSVTGVSTGLGKGYRATATPGAYSVTGTATALRTARRLAAVVGSYAVTGVATVLRVARRQSEAVGSYSLAGTITALRKGFSLPAAAGVYALTGTVTGLKAARRLAVIIGSYAVTGTATGLKFGHSVLATSGAYAITGTAVALRVARRQAESVGSYTVSGVTAGLKVARRLAEAIGAYALSGTAVTLTYTAVAKVLVAAVGSYALAGTSLALVAARRLAGQVGAYALSGTVTALRAMRRLAAAPGSYSASGTPVSLKAQRRIIPSAGAYVLNGSAVGLLASRKEAANSGIYSLSGAATGLRSGRRMSAVVGSYALLGTASNLVIARRLVAQSGSYGLAGGDVDLLHLRPAAPPLSRTYFVAANDTLVSAGDGYDNGMVDAQRTTVEARGKRW